MLLCAALGMCLPQHCGMFSTLIAVQMAALLLKSVARFSVHHLQSWVVYLPIASSPNRVHIMHNRQESDL